MNPSPTNSRYADALEPHTELLIRLQGESLFKKGKVTDVQSIRGQIVGVVNDDERYRAKLTLRGREISGVCSCPWFNDGGPCMHLWALGLAADAEASGGASTSAGKAGGKGARKKRSEPESPWEVRLRIMEFEPHPSAPGVWDRALLEGKRVEYVLNVPQSKYDGSPVIRTYLRTKKKNGEFGAPKSLKLRAAIQSRDLGPEDNELIELLYPHMAEPEYSQYDYRSYRQAPDTNEAALPVPVAVDHVARLAQTGRLFLTLDGKDQLQPNVSWDDGEPWRFRLTLSDDKEGKKHVARLTGDLVRGDEVMPLNEPHVLFGFGLMLHGSTAAAFDPRGTMRWVFELRKNGPLVVPRTERKRLEQNLALTAHTAWERAPKAEEAKEVKPTPKVSLEIGAQPLQYKDSLPCHLRFTYDADVAGAAVPVDPMNPAALVPTHDGQGWIERDVEFEVAAVARLHGMGTMAPAYGYADWHAQVRSRDVAKVVDQALQAGWGVKAEGKFYRSGGAFNASVSSGIDWFDLEAGMDFEGEVAPLPAILAAARSGQRYVELGDGSFGVLPEKWLRSWGLLEIAGKAKGDKLRFHSNQGWILDALLAGRSGVGADQGFADYRERLERFKGIRPAKEPRSFQGELRPYQRLAVGWFGFLRDLGLGGCLADDMGLGKTVQVLALLEHRRLAQKKLDGGPRPTLVVAPNSLVFNWVAEAARFAPKLRTLDYTGADRAARAGDLADPKTAAAWSKEWDLVVTTYGTMRRDAVKLSEMEFDYVVLDEATAIKNASSQVAKAARLMVGRHRLALSGTPIENHLGELWSLFEFLNPGMLGASAAFKRFAKAGRSPGDLEGLSRALAPFFLRRTKGEVLTDLPEKTEQVILCELGKDERQRYDEVRAHYRSVLLGAGGSSGEASGALDDLAGDQKIQVLEALLRLRQCACHPALMDDSLIGESSAKLDELLPRLEQLAEKGHKVLVFSQFTSFLKVLRARLDGLGLNYEYLDGSTRKRGDKVERFQSDDGCKLFLISIKAGGHGLNLTAADYVFIMDPWWNPAVEAQAVDRAHRMGQKKPVFAYRLIAKDTVEEKVLELQGDKRELAAAVIGEGAGVLRDLTRGDLERLLS